MIFKAQYFSVAKQRHREAENPWADTLDLAVQQAVRSISRGLGPSCPKKDLFVDRAGQDLPVRLEQAYDRLGVPNGHRFVEPLSVLTAVLWFLLRGIEIANGNCKDVSLGSNPSTSCRYRCQRRTRQRGDALYRVHACICKPAHARKLHVHVLGRSGVHEVANLFVPGRVSAFCALTMEPSGCPLLFVLRKQWDPEHVFFSGSSEPPSKRQVARLAQVRRVLLARRRHREDLLVAQLEDWAEHACRVAGSQLMARSQIPLPTIQLLGRWGSRWQ